MIKFIKSLFEKTEDQLAQEAWQLANERFNIIKDESGIFVTYCGKKVSLESDEETDIVTRLMAYRFMYVNDYVESKGRVW